MAAIEVASSSSRARADRKTKAKLLAQLIDMGINVPRLTDALTGPRPSRLAFLPSTLSDLSLTLKKEGARTWSSLQHLIDFEIDELRGLFPQSNKVNSDFVSWFVIGCPHSTDIDVLIVVDQHKNGKASEISKENYLRVLTELEEMGYDMTKEIDVSYVVINEDMIVALSKGGIEIQNVLLETYKFWRQKYELPPLKFLRLGVADKLKAIGNFVLTYLDVFVGPVTYSELRPRKVIAFKNGINDMLLCTKDIVLLFEKDNGRLHNATRWASKMKSLIMKYCQLILIDQGHYKYTKDDIIESISLIDKSLVDGIAWYLFRGRKGVHDLTILPRLHGRFCTILDNYLAESTTRTVQLSYNVTDLPSCSAISDNILTLFYRSPILVTDEFTEAWYNTFGRQSANEVFQVNGFNRDAAELILPRLVSEKMLWMAQRSEEWTISRNFYESAHSDPDLIKDTAQGQYNLIRGAITEMLIGTILASDGNIHDALQVKSFVAIQPGLVVSKPGEKNALSCAPDLLFIRANEIVPCEIKTLKHGNTNSGYYRGLELATKQCQSVKTVLIDDVCAGIVRIDRGIIVLSWYEEDRLVLKCITIDL